MPFDLVSIEVVKFISGLDGYFFVFKIETTLEILVRYNLEVIHNFLKSYLKDQGAVLLLGHFSMTVPTSPFQ